jgi:O-acetyl-ADP-ribose deacetylase (regulator of RNase III)
MGIKVYQGDITTLKVDAIVNAANRSLLGGGGVDGAIHRAAGKELLAECRTLNGCETGEAKITGGYKLPAKYVIHTVGPVWHGGSNNEEQLLQSAYANSLKVAAENDVKTIAFPAISTGVYGFPKDKAAVIAIETIGEFLKTHDMEVILTAFSAGDAERYEKLLSE